MLYKLQAGFVIIESDLPVGVCKAPGLHHWPNAVGDFAGFVGLVDDLWNELGVMVAGDGWGSERWYDPWPP